MSLSGEEARRIIKEIQDATGDYGKWALSARQEYINLRLKQDREIRKLYLQAADRIAKQLHSYQAKGSGYLYKRHLEELEILLRQEAARFNDELTDKLKEYTQKSAEAGSGYSKAILIELVKQAGADGVIDMVGIQKLFGRVNTQAVEAIWARTKKGLKLSDRIWQTSNNARDTIRDLIQESVATGQDAVKTARMLERYVQGGVNTLATEYPDMMKRMAGRVPKDISYEALRLARTETTAAFGEGTIAAARVTPSYIGMKWILSNSHPAEDICNTLAEADGWDLGPGVYPPGEEPFYPAHPNCLCVLVPVHEKPEEFVQKLKNWRDNPNSEPDIEKWYTSIYQKEVRR
jgi:hypothetical protein